MNETKATDERRKNHVPRKGPSPIEYLLLGIIIIACILLGTQDQELFLKIFYSEFSFLILMIMIIEFLVIKSSDRSKVYLSELEKLRIAGESNLSLVREVDDQLEQALKLVVELKEAGDADSGAAMGELHNQLTDALTHLRTRK